MSTPILVLLTLACVFSLAIFTAYRVGQRIKEDRLQRKHLVAYRELVDSCARETAAGARVLEAVESAARRGGVLGQRLEEVSRQVRYGAKVTEASRITVNQAGAAGREPNAQVELDITEFCQLWELSQATGMGFSPLAESIVEDLDAHAAQQDKAVAAMAGARLTEILLLAMPVGAVGIGQSMGLGAFGILIGTVLGLGLLLVGSMLACAGVLWTEALTVRVLGGVGRRAGPMGQALAIARHLDIFALGLDAGLPVARAWGVGLGVQGKPEKKKPGDLAAAWEVEPLLALGAGAGAWAGLAEHEHYGPVVRQAIQQARSGTRLAAGARAQAVRVRQQVLRKTEAGAEKVLIAIAAPLTLCFLPAFVLIGLIPLVMGLAGI